MKQLRIYLLGIFIAFNLLVCAQDNYVDKENVALLDSLDARISFLNTQIPKLSANRDAKYFHTKRELDMTIFVRAYEEYVFNEDLVQAQKLIDSRLKVSEKRSDTYAIEYYSSYKTKLTRLRAQKQAQYQQLFAREKDFAKEYNRYIAPGDNLAYLKTLRMLDLAIKYAKERRLDETLTYLLRYKKYTKALLFDLHCDYDLEKLTASESNFMKVFDPLISHDSLDVILASGELVDNCLLYSSFARAPVDTTFFLLQKIAVANAIADWNERQGLSAELASLTEQSIVARRDSINKEGIYQWNDLIIVIGSVNFESNSEIVRKGEAIIDADKTLINYIRVEKLARIGNSVEMGKTTIIPVKYKEQLGYFQYDIDKQAWQYIVAYKSVISPKFTQEMSRFLPPLQFQDEIKELIE
jgi:hypothetical protein